MKFKELTPNINFPKMEEEILELWRERRTFERSVSERPLDKQYVFYDGPPFATGLPHYGHLLVGTIKDVVARYHTMQGCRVERRFGWDCHGLPIEFEIESQLGLKGRKDIERYGVAQFNDACRSIVLRYTSEWRQTVARMGRWVDFENEYRTMDVSYMESVWAVFKRLWDMDLIYEGYRVVPYSWRIGAPLSNFEANLNYKDIQDPSITVRFQLDGGLTALAWTTTPWTLPSNLALAVDPEREYAILEENHGMVPGEQIVLLAERIPYYWSKSTDYRVIGKIPGSSLVGSTYQPLFPFFGERKEHGAFQVLAADFVTAEVGTGIVHIAPAFGENDFRLAREHGIELVDPVDDEGRFTSLVPQYEGMMIKDSDKAIILDLKREGKIFRHETYTHSYPFCYRSDTPLIYKAITAWYVRVESFKPNLSKNNQQINWIPEHIKDGRFGKWLGNAQDWNISRNRFWGNPLPIWRNEETKETICIGSRAELEALSGREVSDLHKHVVDDVTIPSSTGRGVLRRIPEVLDCWFESGAMPYAQAHYPFENEKAFETRFPADFVAEGLDQTRGWFYTLMVLSTALFDQPAFRNVIVNGLILAEDGRKMSKRLKNYPEPNQLIADYGADAVRIYLLNSGAVRGEDLRFSENDVREVVRKVLLPWWNSLSFLATYAIVDSWDPEHDMLKTASSHKLDVWIRVKLEKLRIQTESAMEAYELSAAVSPLLQFLDSMTNWYIRCSRRRFWRFEAGDDKISAFTTLYSVLLDFTELMAPFAPFMAEHVYEILRLTSKTSDTDSVHLRILSGRQPITDEERETEQSVDLARMICEMGRDLRTQAGIRLRQPLASVKIGTVNSQQRVWIESVREIIIGELNVKTVEVLDDPTQIARVNLKPNFTRLGPRLGARMKEVIEIIRDLDSETVHRLAFGGRATIADLELSHDDVLVNMEPALSGFLVAARGSIVVSIDPNVSEALMLEGIAREIINRIQRIRKEMNLSVETRIAAAIATEDPILHEVLSRHKVTVEEETLSRITLGRRPGMGNLEREFEIEGISVTISVDPLFSR